MRTEAEVIARRELVIEALGMAYDLGVPTETFQLIDKILSWVLFEGPEPHALTQARGIRALDLLEKMALAIKPIIAGISEVAET